MFTIFFRSVFILPFFVFYSISSCAQGGFTSAGGEAYGSGGTVSYSCGLVAYQQFADENFSVTEGIQHGFGGSLYYVNAPFIDIYNFKIFPNPTSGMVHLQTESAIPGTLIMCVYTMTGEKILEKTINSQRDVISLDHFANGNYLLTLFDTENFYDYFKIIKQR